jgi:hypothetical protein
VGRTAADTGVGAERPRHAEEVVTDPVVGRGCEDMERTDWLDKGFDASDARFLMVTAISHHRFRSPIWERRRSESSAPSSWRSIAPRNRPSQISARHRGSGHVEDRVLGPEMIGT